MMSEVAPMKWTPKAGQAAGGNKIVSRRLRETIRRDEVEEAITGSRDGGL
jgi:hypothetical protein